MHFDTISNILLGLLRKISKYCNKSFINYKNEDRGLILQSISFDTHCAYIIDELMDSGEMYAHILPTKSCEYPRANRQCPFDW